MLYLGTHNSGTAGPLVWWQWIFTPIFQLVSKCQNLTISEQLDMGVKVFNLQVTLYCGEWHFSHGLCIYKEKLEDALLEMKKYASSDEPIYIQLYLDKNFFLGQNKERFRHLVLELNDWTKDKEIYILSTWIEGTDEHILSDTKIKLTEKYWTMSWAKTFGKTWVDKLPLPKRHAKKYNGDYKYKYDNWSDDREYLMLDFVEIP